MMSKTPTLSSSFSPSLLRGSQGAKGSPLSMAIIGLGSQAQASEGVPFTRLAPAPRSFKVAGSSHRERESRG